VAANGITRFGLGGDAITSGVFPMPPEAEQRAIAAFLDRETARIDALVAKKERLIELLQEQRTALITRAVTKGLDPNVPLKNSGVEWLGEIPAHWTCKHLRWAIMFQRGHDLPTSEREEGQVPVVSSSGVSSTHSLAVAKAPGIVTGRYGTIGHFHLITQDYWPLNTTLYSIDLRGNDPRFLRYMLTHLSPLFLLNAVKSAVPGVDRNDIHPTRTGVPPISEQREIADFLDAKSEEIDSLIAKVREAIDHLKELRTALISAAVTGKIDVREEIA
jgi:type I restriction enzyme S subunit